MAAITKTIGQITGLSGVLAGWRKLITAGEADTAAAVKMSADIAALVHQAEQMCAEISATRTMLEALEAACYTHQLEPAALAMVHTAMETNRAALTRQMAALTALQQALEQQRAANKAHQQALEAARAALAYMNRTHVPRGEVEATTGARADRAFGTS